MLLLLAFALIAGAGTAVTPCVLPILPALLSASAAGGRRRPLGIVLGLAVTFTVAIVLLAQLVKGVGLAAGAPRTIAIVVLIGFGIVLLVPALAERMQARLSRLARLGPTSRGTGFVSGLAVGGALGFVCAPCAGPILAAVTAVSATAGANARIVAIALAYAVGLSAVLLVYALAGRAVVARIRRRATGPIIERTLAVVLLATGLVMATNLDVRFEQSLASSTGFLTDPTQGLQNSRAVQDRLAALRPRSRFAAAQARAAAGARGETLRPMPLPAGIAIAGVTTPALPRLGRAPDFTDTQRWFNTPDDAPLHIRDLRGHVVLVDFWTYTCINCIRTLPFLKGLYATYHRYGLDIVGVETPEFTFEQEASNVAQAIASDGIAYPVVQDNRYGTWDAYQNEYWPAEYLIDATGEVRHTQFGEGHYLQDEAAVRQLLYDAGAHHLPPPMTAHATLPSANLQTPETYLDPARAESYDELAEGFAQPPQLGVHTYTAPSTLALNEFALNGRWHASNEAITPVGAAATISGRFGAAHVYLVMTSSNDRPRTVTLALDGHPIGSVTVTGQRLYTLVSLPRDEQRTITVTVPHGVSAYDFTFG